MSIYKKRIAEIREEMQKNNIHISMFNNADPHISEYVSTYWKDREWLSGFTGSNGIILLSQTELVLFTDSRYELQAQEELKSLDAQMIISNHLLEEIYTWLNLTYIKEKKTINLTINHRVFSSFLILNLERKLNKHFKILYLDLLKDKKESKPLENSSFFILEEKYSGESIKSKISRIKEKLKEKNIHTYLLTALDDIAWTFNLRGKDIPYNPLKYAFASISQEEVLLFIDINEDNLNEKKFLEKQGVKIYSYKEIEIYLQKVNKKTVFLNPQSINHFLYTCIDKTNHIITNESIVALLKSIKNTNELKGFRVACLKEGVALVKLLMWIENNLEKEKNISEAQVLKKIEELHQQASDYFSESFQAIVAYQENGAIVHYSLNEKTSKTIKKEGLLLIDSGAHFMHGTTDITRTFSLGEESSLQQKEDYTLVLKGHISLATAVFPIGTNGGQLDVLARQHLWNKQLNYGHGTGHGIGHFLCVHEGPVGIRPNNQTRLEAGMVLSNEPGIYRKNEYGIRLENMLSVKNTENSDFLQFESLSLFPFDKKCIDFNLLSKKEIAWIKKYHNFVIKKLKPFLNLTEINWLTNYSKF